MLPLDTRQDVRQLRPDALSHHRPPGPCDAVQADVAHFLKELGLRELPLDGREHLLVAGLLENVADEEAFQVGVEPGERLGHPNRTVQGLPTNVGRLVHVVFGDAGDSTACVLVAEEDGVPNLEELVGQVLSDLDSVLGLYIKNAFQLRSDLSGKSLWSPLFLARSLKGCTDACVPLNDSPSSNQAPSCWTSKRQNLWNEAGKFMRFKRHENSA